MKITIVASRKNKNCVRRAKFITDIARKQGHSVNDSMLTRTLEEENLDLETTFKKHMNSIKSADLIIAESTQYSAGLGFLIATAINERKHVLCLHPKDVTKEASITLRGAKSKLLSYIKYSEKELEEILSNYCDDVKSKLDTKFILIIPPAIDKYLRWVSDERRMHKAQIVREAVNAMMNKDKEYKGYMKEIA